MMKQVILYSDMTTTRGLAEAKMSARIASDLERSFLNQSTVGLRVVHLQGKVLVLKEYSRQSLQSLSAVTKYCL